MMLGSMRARVTMAFASALFLLLALVGTGLVLFTRISTTSRDQTLLTATAAGIRSELAAGVISTRQPEKLINTVGLELNATGVSLLIVENSKVIARSLKRVPDQPEKAGWLTLGVPDTGTRHIILAHPTNESELEIHRLTLAIVILGGVVWAAATLGAWVLVGRVLSPIDQLSETARRAPLDAAQLEAPSNDDEVVRLVGTLNDFLARLHEGSRSKERFYAAASHELRTPLQGLAGFLEIGLSRPRSHDDLMAVLREAQGQSAKLVKLTSDLLAINQLETSTTKAANEWLDAADAFERALQPLEAQKVQKGIHVHCVWPEQVEDAEIYAPWSHLEMLARNLCENAIKYAPPAGEVNISLSDHVLRVQNDVEHAVDGDLERLFEPFYRPDVARGAKTGGNGLGLTICKAICDTNGWEITLRRLTLTPPPHATASGGLKGSAPLTLPHEGLEIAVNFGANGQHTGDKRAGLMA